MAADFRGIARGPGAFAEDASGMGVARVGHRPLAALRPSGVFGGDQAQALHQCSWGITPCQSTHGRHQGYGHRAWHATQGLQSLAHRGQTPGLPGLLACLREPLEACGMLMNRADVFLKNDLWRGRRTDDFREPPQVGRTPIGPAGGADSVSEHKGVETALGVFEITECLFTRPGEVAHGCIVDLRDIDRSELACASEASALPSVPAVRFDPITSLFRNEGRRHHPAIVVFVPERPIAPGATGASLRDKEEVCGFRWHRTEEVIDVTLACPHGAQGGDLGAMLLGDIRHGHRRLVDIHAEEECARLRHG
jgi:hypothetical protein